VTEQGSPSQILLDRTRMQTAPPADILHGIARCSIGAIRPRT
jgi:hypothetical protein